MESIIKRCKFGLSQVRRTIPIDDTQPDQLERVARSLKAIEAVNDIRTDSRGKLRIRYDASCIGIWDIERILEEDGITLPFGYWWRVKLAWYRFLDHNARSKAISGEGSCCSPRRQSDK